MASLVRDQGGLRLVQADPPAAIDTAWTPMATASQASLIGWLRAVQLSQEVLRPLTPKVLDGMFGG
jgi:hypothetical protein